MTQERLNRRFTLWMGLAVVLLGTCYVVVHALQTRRQAPALLALAGRAEEEGQLTRAERFLSLYLGLRPGDAEALARYGQMLEKRATSPRERWKVMGMYENVLLRDPERHDVRRRLVTLALELNGVDVAMVHLKVLAEAFPQEGDLAYQFGRCLELKREYAKAAEAYATAARLAPQQLDSSGRLAEVYRQLGLPGDADRVLDDMVAANPKEFRAYLVRAAYRRQYGSTLAPAAEDVAAAQRLAPQEVDVLLAAADLARDQGKLDEARGLLRHGLEQKLKEPRLHLALVGLEMRAGRPEEARANLRRGLEALPDERDLLWLAAQFLIDDGKLDEARERITQLRQAKLPAVNLDLLDGRILMAERKWLKAARDLERVRALLANVPDLAVQTDLLLGQCYQQLGDPDRQLLAYQRVTARNPLHVGARDGSVRALVQLGRLEDAVAEAQTLTQLPRVPAAGWLPLARLRLLQVLRAPPAQRKWADVETLLDKAARAAAPETEVALLRAEVLAAQGRVEQARTLLEGLRTKDPRRLEPWLALARVAGRDGRPEAVLRLLADAERQVGDRVELRLARLPYLAGRPDAEVAQTLKQLAGGLERWTPEDRARLLRGLGDVYEQIGQAAEAERLWLQAADVQPDDLGLRERLFEVSLRTGVEPTRRQRLAEIQRIEGPDGPLGRYGDACCLLAEARAGDRGLLGKARAQLRVVAGQRPAWARVPLRLAEIAELEGQIDQAIENYQRALDLGEQRVPVVRRLVQLLYRQQRYDQVEELVRKLQDVVPLAAFLHRAAAETALGKREPERALEWARQAVAADSTDYRDQLWLGQMFSAAKHEAEAEAAFRRAVRLAEKQSEPWLVLVRFQVLRGQKDLAEKTLREAQGKIDRGEAPLALAYGYEILGTPERAAEQIRRALAARPDDLGVLRAVAEFYLRNGPPLAAIPPLRTLLEARLRAPVAVAIWARRRLAVLVATLGRGAPPLREALGLLDDNLRQQGDDVEDQRVRAVVLATRPGRRPEAIRFFEGLRQRSLLTRADEFQLASLYEAEDNEAAARTVLERLVTADAGDPRVLGAYVRCLLRRGATEEAQAWLAKVEQLAPQKPETLGLRARLLFARGQEAEAVDFLQKYAADPKADPKAKPEEALLRLRRVAALLEDLSPGDHSLHPASAQAAEELYRQYAARSKPLEGLRVLTDYLARHERVSEALDVCERALRTSPAEAVTAAASTVVASAPAREEHLRRLEGWLLAALAKKPGAVIFLAQLAALRERQGRYPEAEVLYREALEKDPRDVVSLNNLAYLLALQGVKGSEALELCERAMSRAGAQAAFLDTRGLAQLALGQPVAALADLEEAVAELPAAPVYLHLTRAYLEAGRREAAAGAWQKAQAASLRPGALHPLDRDGFQRMSSEMAKR